jgi:hypothetical protein
MLRQTTSRIRAHATSSLPIHQIRRFFTLDISAAKAAATHWDPALRLPTNSRHNDTPDAEDVKTHPWMTTYSAFDPGMIRPLLPIVKQSGFIAKTKEIKEMKPWPYSLPAFLRPKAGTTYVSTMHGGAKQSKVSRRVGVLQAVLYGIPEPDKVEAKKGVLYKVAYGVKEDEEEKKDDEVVGK